MTDMAMYNYGAQPRKKIQFVNVPAWIVTGCIFFNFALCFINTNIKLITPLEIILCEMVLVGAAVAYGFRHIDKMKLYWLVIMGCQMVLLLLMSFLRDEVLLKPIRDVIILPVFIILGLSAARLNFTRFVTGFGISILLIGLLEAFFSGRFLQIFNFKSFYVAKGMLFSETITDINTFASGVRPGGRFLFDFIDVHRISSVFLEPVSLGFFAFFLALYAMAVRVNISRALYYFILSVSLVLIWLSDARMALGCLVLLFLLKPLFIRLDHRFAVLIFPAILVTSYVAFSMGLLSSEGEGIGRRIFVTMRLLSEMDMANLIGLRNFERDTYDSGIGELIGKQGILGLLLFWLPPIFFLKRVPAQARIYLYGAMLFISIGLMLSSAIFTIKTAAFLWFGYGYIIARNNLLEKEEAIAA